MATTIDTRGTIDTPTGASLTVSVPATFTYLPETAVQAVEASGSITHPGVYTINNATEAGVFLPGPSTIPGGVVVLRTLGTAGKQHFLTGWTMFPPALEYQLQTLGFSVLAFGLLRRWIDLNPRFNPQGRFAVQSSRIAKALPATLESAR
jgi:hypothetical protein